MLDLNLHGEPSFPVALQLEPFEVPYMFVTGDDDWVIPAEYKSVPRMMKPCLISDVVEALGNLIADPDSMTLSAREA